jgi:hypothetical protein
VTFERPTLAHLRQGADGVLQRHVGVGTVELIEVDALELEAPQAALALLAQVLGPAVGVPHVRAGPDQAALGGDRKVVGVGMQRLGDQVLAHLGAVGVGGVDQVDPEVDGPA